MQLDRSYKFGHGGFVVSRSGLANIGVLTVTYTGLLINTIVYNTTLKSPILFNKPLYYNARGRGLTTPRPSFQLKSKNGIPNCLRTSDIVFSSTAARPLCPQSNVSIEVSPYNPGERQIETCMYWVLYYASWGVGRGSCR